MRILLNLLPPEKKDALSKSFYFRFFTWQTVLLLGLELFYIAILFCIFFILSREVKSAEDSASIFVLNDSNAQQLSEFQETFKTANASAAAIMKYTHNHFHWTNLFELIDKLTPERVVITDIAMQDFAVTLNGQAQTRDDFLLFEDQLKKEGCVSDVRVPITNLFSKTEVEFQIEFKIKRDCLRFAETETENEKD